MASLIVVDPVAQVRIDGGKLIVQSGERDKSVPIETVASLILFDRVSISRPALDALLLKGAPVCYFRRGRLIGASLPHRSAGAALRMRQTIARSDPKIRARFAGDIVVAKIASQRALVARRAWSAEDDRYDSIVAQLDEALAGVRSAEAIDQIRGWEGHAGSLYFEALGKLVRPPFKFRLRQRRPPPDPVNALLSLGYALTSAHVLTAVAAVGLDPYIGYLHESNLGIQALAQDLVEPFRAPIADRWALRLINNRMVSPDDFERAEEGGVRLEREALKRVLREYDKLLGQPLPVVYGYRSATALTAIGQSVRRLASRLRKVEMP